MAKHKKIFKSKSNFKFVVIVILCSIFVLSFIQKYGNFQLTSNNLALVSYIPNFNNLTLDDLPNSQIDKTYDYNGHLLAIGKNKIVEYDKENNRYLRINDPKVLGCIFDSAKIDDFLFISCNAHYKDESNISENSKIVSSSIFKIDLKTGKIVKKYFGKLLNPDPELIANNEYTFKTKGLRSNLSLGSKGNILYLSSWDGIEKMDVVSERISVYSLPGESKSGTELVGTHLLSDSQWFRIHPPIKPVNFKSISPLKEGKYYILADDGLYSLVGGQFQNQIIKSSTAGETFRSIFSRDGRYLVFVGPASNMGAITGIYAYLMDLDKNTLKDLSMVSKYPDDKATKILPKIDKGVFEESNGSIFLNDTETGDVLLSINTKSNILKY